MQRHLILAPDQILLALEDILKKIYSILGKTECALMPVGARPDFMSGEITYLGYSARREADMLGSCA